MKIELQEMEIIDTLRKVTRHAYKGNKYPKPKVILSDELNYLIGREFYTLKGRATLELDGYSLKGDVIMLFFPEEEI